MLQLTRVCPWGFCGGSRSCLARGQRAPAGGRRALRPIYISRQALSFNLGFSCGQSGNELHGLVLPWAF